MLEELFAETSRTTSNFTPDQFAALKETEVQKYQKLTRETGNKAE